MKSSVISKVGSLLLMEVDQLVRIVLLLFIYHHVSWQKVVYGLKSETNRALRLQEEYNKHLRPNHKGRHLILNPILQYYLQFYK